MIDSKGVTLECWIVYTYMYTAGTVLNIPRIGKLPYGAKRGFIERKAFLKKGFIEIKAFLK